MSEVVVRGEDAACTQLRIRNRHASRTEKRAALIEAKWHHLVAVTQVIKCSGDLPTNVTTTQASKPTKEKNYGVTIMLSARGRKSPREGRRGLGRQKIKHTVTEKEAHALSLKGGGQLSPIIEARIAETTGSFHLLHRLHLPLLCADQDTDPPAPGHSRASNIQLRTRSCSLLLSLLALCLPLRY